MCIIAVVPEKVSLSRAQMKIMWDANPDGAGFMFADGKQVHIRKGFMTLDAFYEAVQEAGPLRKMVMHFRIKTHGAISPELTHPFEIRKGKLAMVHNGVIRSLTNETSEAESDTAVFARKFSEAYVNPLLAIKNEFHRDMLEAYIGFSKMVFMDEAGHTYILNESLGEWDKSSGVWYSNDRYKPYRFTGSYTTGNYTAAPLNPKVVFPWEAGKFDGEDRASRQAELDGVFGGTAVSQGKGERVEHVTRSRRSGKGSENSNKRAVQKPLLGLPSTSHWDKIPFPGTSSR